MKTKTPIGTDRWFGITFRGRHLSVMILTVTKRQDAEMRLIMEDGFRAPVRAERGSS